MLASVFTGRWPATSAQFRRWLGASVAGARAFDAFDASQRERVRDGAPHPLALACIGAAEAGSALAEGTTPLTAANFDDFVEGALAEGKTAMVRFIASEG